MQETKYIAIQIILLAIDICKEENSTYINGTVARISGEVDQILQDMMDYCQKGGINDVYTWLNKILNPKVGR